MSFRDLRNMSEILRTVGYPRLISLENFRIPNFRLVADIGIWLVRQYEPKLDFPTSIDTEHDRVIFIRMFAEFIVTKVHVKLNTKRLYQADGYAVKELIKVASVLHTAMKEAEKAELGIVRTAENKSINFDVTANLEKLKRARALGSEITQRGVLLYDMLSKEVALREVRNLVLTKAFELDEVERLIRTAIQSSQGENSKYTTMIGTVEGNINNLDIKIDKKKQEIERSEKRFQTLKKVRPAFMDEYERLQADLNTAYKRYVNRFRCLSYLQKQMEELNRLELERKAEERSLRQEGGDDYFFMDKNSRGDVSGSDDDDSQINEAFNKAHNNNNNNNIINKQKQQQQQQQQVGRSSRMRDSLLSRGPNNATSTKSSVRSSRNRTSLGRSRQIYGSMLGGGDDSGDSESDLILVDGDGDNSDLDDPDDDDDLELHDTAIRMARSMGVPTHIQDHIMRQEIKHAANIMHGVDVPPAPSVSTVPSSANINVLHHKNQHLASSPLQLKSSSAVPNGALRNH